MKGNVDLHIHTTASDGTCTPSRTVETAREMGLAAIAVTDHDTASGVSEAMVAGAKLGIEVIPGIEMSAEYEGRGVHIVGLFIDPAAASIRAAMDFAVRSRDRRNETILAAMNADGLDITADELRETFPGAVWAGPTSPNGWCSGAIRRPCRRASSATSAGACPITGPGCGWAWRPPWRRSGTPEAWR